MVPFLGTVENSRVEITYSRCRLPGRLRAGQRPLEPLVEVRILPGQPSSLGTRILHAVGVQGACVLLCVACVSMLYTALQYASSFVSPLAPHP